MQRDLTVRDHIVSGQRQGVSGQDQQKGISTGQRQGDAVFTVKAPRQSLNAADSHTGNRVDRVGRFMKSRKLPPANRSLQRRESALFQRQAVLAEQQQAAFAAKDAAVCF